MKVIGVQNSTWAHSQCWLRDRIANPINAGSIPAAPSK